ncbi:MAG: BamA/TamA family outer membrane protein [Leptolyngbyaceae cyanobacterium bins.59]|nr:BamA/TamA family outer membrane protein [Leptolyngbyaceae cyanobacterium bins.59]
MDVQSNTSKNRLSPVLVALLATSAALGVQPSASGQTLYYAPIASGSPNAVGSQEPESNETSLQNPERLNPLKAQAVPEQAENSQATNAVSSVSIPEQFPVERPADLSVASRQDPLASDAPLVGVPLPEVDQARGATLLELAQASPSTPPPAGQGTPTTPQPAPTTPAPQTSPLTPAPEAAPTGEVEPRVLVAEVAVSGVEGTLLDEVYRVIRTRPGRTATRTELQEDINAIFNTGFFANVRAVPEDTPLGVRVTFEVRANPALNSVRIEGNQVLPQSVVDNIFKAQYGQILNLRRFQEGIREVNKWYQDNGYVLAQVTDAPQVTDNGVVTLQVAEGVVEDIQVRFLNKEGDETDDKGQPIQGRTRSFIVTREFTIKPGTVFNRTQAERDLQRVFGLGIFEDVRLSLSPGQDPRKVVVVANVIERNSGSLAAGLGISSASGLFGTVSYQEQNLGGNNQKLGAEIQVGERELLFDLNFTDPWIAGDPFRTSYTVNLFNRRSLSLVFDGGKQEVRLPGGDRPRIDRLGGGISFTRPLEGGWVASLGAQYQRISVRDVNRNIARFDERGNPLSFSRTGIDDLFTVQFGAVQDRRNDPLRPTSGSFLRLGTEQSIPLGSGSIFLNRLRGSYSYYIPVRYINFSDGPQAFAFNIQAGAAIGDLPPYEAFALGGSNSVRGYDEGALGSARNFIQATAEYRFPIFSIVGGALFFDAATDFGTGSSVLGNPAGIRRKPGSGFGYGLGVRIQSPLGPIRVDYGISDEGSGRIHFGIGERF